MAFKSQTAIFRIAAVTFGIGVTLVALPSPASAGFFDRLFGAVREAVEAPVRPSNNRPSQDPFTSLANRLNPPPQEQLRGDNRGPAKAFCVRTCDGHFFPVQAHAGQSAAEACHSFCPASETRLYGGSNIDTAAASDGSRYANLPSAFVYRKQLVAGCTCNGRNAFGLAHINAAHDATLRQGDIVATKDGLMAFAGNRNNVADFTPVENYSRLPKTTRDRLAETKVSPPAPATDIAAAGQARAEARR